MFQVFIDSSICEGHGRCYMLAPEIFKADELGQGVVIKAEIEDPTLEQRALLAVENCPENAISCSHA